MNRRYPVIHKLKRGELYRHIKATCSECGMSHYYYKQNHKKEETQLFMCDDKFIKARTNMNKKEIINAIVRMCELTTAERIVIEMDLDSLLSAERERCEKGRLLDKAYSQFLGYEEYRNGGTFASLTRAMGLTKKEWEKLQKEYDLYFLTDEDKSEIAQVIRED